MPGPFNSDKIKGVFERDTANIKQNDIWSSATFNRFVKSVYNVFYNESAYSRVFYNPEKPRLMLDCSVTSSSTDSAVDSGVGNAVKTPNVWFHDNPTKKRIEMRVVDRDFDVDLDPDGTDHRCDADVKRLLFSGRGDVSENIKPYALFQVLDEPSITPPEVLADLSESDADVTNVQYDAYCCITYEEGYPYVYGTPLSENTVTPRYSSLSEITFQFDPTLDGTVITRVNGDKVRVKGTAPYLEDVCTKLTLSFGPDVTLSAFVDYMNSLVDVSDSVHKYKAVIVGQALANQKLIEALMLSSDPSDIPEELTTKTVRFVPIRPCISILGSEAGEGFEKLTITNDGISSITEYIITKGGAGVPVFKNTGTYGFLISNSMADAPVMHSASELSLIYVPNKGPEGHYVRPVGASPLAIPEWYSELPGRIQRAKTEDFNTEFFLIPYITVTDRTIEIGEFSIDIDTLLTYGDLAVPILPGPYSSKLLESRVLYDSYRLGNLSPKMQQLLIESDRVRGKFEPMLSSGNNVSEGGGIHTFPLGDNTNVDLTSTNPKVFALERTLQFMLGVNWKNNNIIWIDPLVGVSDNGYDSRINRAEKIYGSVNQAIHDDAVWGRGSLINSCTVFVHVTSCGEAVPYYSNDPASDKFQTEDSVRHRNMWRRIYSEYLPSGVKHIALKAKPGRANEDVSMLDSDFPGIDFAAGPQPLFIQLVQDPNLDYTNPGNYGFQSTLLGVTEFPDYTDHLLCQSGLTGEYIDLNSEYYPLFGQDFSSVSHVVIDDPYAGMRIPGKVPEVRVRLSMITANKLTYIPREHIYNSTSDNYEFEGLSYANGTQIDSYVYDHYASGVGEAPAAFYPVGSANARPESYFTRGRLDWFGFNHEVVLADSNINSLKQSIHQFEDSATGEYLVKGSCITFCNINSSSKMTSITAAYGIEDMNIHEPEGADQYLVTIPSAGELMLWRYNNISGSVGVSYLRLCGKNGAQKIEYTPVAWPFGLANGTFITNVMGVAYQYALTKDSSNSGRAKVTGSPTYSYISGFGVGEGYPDGDVTGGSIDLTFKFEDRRDSDAETRTRTEFKSLIRAHAPVSNCDLTLHIDDTGNAAPWYPPNYDPDTNSGYYSAGTWQAFDPEIFLPVARWNEEYYGPSANKSLSEWAINFTFIETCHYNEGSGAGAVFRDCSVSIDLTKDSVYYEVESVGRHTNNEPFDTYYAGNRMFFSSRIFRKSAYIFYLAGSSPVQFCDGFWRREPAAKCSTNLNLTITADIVPAPLDPGDRTTVARVAWWPDTANITAVDPNISGFRNYSICHTAQFIFGVSGGSIAIDNMRVVPVIRQGVDIEKYADALPTIADGTTSSDRNTAIALFSVVSNCKIDIGLLDTTYPCVDEWYYLNPAWYSPDGGPTYALWLETVNGFQFFTQPVTTVNNDYIPKFEFNKSNTVNIALWTTRTSMSGIYGLSDSEMNINYDFNTQNYALRSYSAYPYDWVGNLAYEDFHNVEAVDKKYYTAKRPRFWGQLKSDPGVMHEYEHRENGSRQAACTLSCYPLFYLADVDSCRLNFQLSAVSPKRYRYKYASNNPDDVNYNYGVSLPTNTLKYPFPPSGSDKYRTRLYKALTTNSSSLPNAGASSPVDVGSDRSSEGWYLTYAADARRSLRLAVGFAPVLDRSNRYVTPSSCNNISGMFTRVNLIAGMYNHVSGWCYELTPVAVSSTSGEIRASVSCVPLRYLAEESISNWELVAFEHPTSENGFIVVMKNDAGVVAGLLSLANRSKSFTRKLFTLDNSVPRCYNSTPGYYDAESDIFEVLAYTQNVAVQNNALSFGTPVSSMNEDNSLPHTTWGFEDSFDYYIERDSSPSISTMSVNKVYPKMEDVTKYGTWSSVEHYSASLAYAVDVYNTADLFTIQIATQDVPYFLTAGTGWTDATVPTVPKGYPLHTVLSYNGPTTDS